MLFQTYEFFILFASSYVAFLLIKKTRIRQCALLCASVVFYAWGSLTYVFLFIMVIIWTYVASLIIDRLKHSPKKKKAFFIISIALSFIPLILLKYVPFLINQLFHVVPPAMLPITKLMLPIGISFYTFQAVGYIIDVYRGDQEAEKDIIVYALFISFFPQLVAGPIERSSNIIHQLKKFKSVQYEDAAVGLRLMAIGLFMKIFVADTIGYIVNFTYNNLYSTSGHANAILLVIATFFFGIQIYCDFNGYSIIAKGTARSMGITLMNNFDSPYFSKSVTEFWRRWHRSLSFWFRDYVFISMGGSRRGELRTIINLLVTFIISGIWHGANWTFAIWGLLNGIFLVVEKLTGLHNKHKVRWQARIGWVYTYLFINFSWIFFRAGSLDDAIYIIRKICTSLGSEIFKLLSGQLGLFDVIPQSGLYMWNLALSLMGVCLVFFYDLYERKRGSVAENLSKIPLFARWTVYVIIMFLALGFGQWGAESQFIYFRF